MMSKVPLTPEQLTALRLQQEMDNRNRPLTDEELDELMPGPSEGFEVAAAPADYKPISTPARRLMATPTPMGGAGMYQIPDEQGSLAKEQPRMINDEV